MDSLAGRPVLVTGAAGFVGANLVKALLRQGAEVHAVVRPITRLWRLADDLSRLELHLVDLTDRAGLEAVVAAARPELIFHLAAPGGHPSGPRERLELLSATVLGTANLLEAASRLDYRRFVHAGSSLEYGARAAPLNEADRLEPSTFRGAAKAAATLLCLQHARAERRPITVLRLFSVYGFWEPPGRLVPTTILAVLQGRDIALTAPGYRHDFVFVDDVVDAVLLAAGTQGVDGEVINVGSGQQWCNEDVVAMVQSLAGRRVNVRVGAYPARPSDTAHWVADVRKAGALLGWHPRHDLAGGLQKTIEWWRHHHHVYAAVAAASGHREDQ